MMRCERVDELAAAFALDAVEPEEHASIAAHLATCREPHVEARQLIGADRALAAAAAPVIPSGELRDRLMATIGRVPQEMRAGAGPRSTSSRWQWLSPLMARRLAVGGMAVSLLLAVVAGGLWSRLQDREAALRATAATLAGAESAYRVTGEAGSGYLVETEGTGATLILAGVEDPPADRLYELWLIDEGGQPVAVGVASSTADELTIVPVERDLDGFVTFAVTVERERVDAPTTAPVLVADLTA